MQRRKIVLQSPRLLQKKKRRNIIRLAVFVLILIAFFVGFYIFVHRPFINITKIEVSGSEVLEPEVIKQKAMEVMSGNVFYLIPKTNIFLYPKSALENILKSSFPRIETLSLGQSNNTLHINLTEKLPKALWCNDQDKCFFMNEEGMIFAGAPVFKGSVYKQYGGMITGNPIGQVFLNNKDLSKIKKIYENLDAFKITVAKIDVTSLKEINLQSVFGTIFLIDLTKSVDDIIDNIQTILTSDRFKDSLPKLGGIEYIDLRFGSKVFFKKNGSGKSTGNNNATTTKIK